MDQIAPLKVCICWNKTQSTFRDILRDPALAIRIGRNRDFKTLWLVAGDQGLKYEMTPPNTYNTFGWKFVFKLKITSMRVRNDKS